MDSNYDSDFDSGSDFELPDDIIEDMTKNMAGVPVKRMVRLRDFLSTELELMTGSKEDKAFHLSQYDTCYRRRMNKIEDLELRLEKLKEVEKLTHYTAELDALFLKLYPFRKDPEKFKEMQFVVSQRNIMKVFQQNHDIFMTRIRSLDDKLDRMTRKAAKVYLLTACCLSSEKRAEMLERQWEPEDAEKWLSVMNMFIGLLF